MTETTPLSPLLAPTPGTYVLRDQEFHVGDAVALTAAETEKACEIHALHAALRARLDAIYHDVHTATRPWLPALHVAYHGYQRMFAAYRRAIEDLVWAVQDRLGCALPVGVNVAVDPPLVYVRAAGPEDAPALSVQDVAALTYFKRKLEEPRALAMALHNAFRVEDGVPVEFSLPDWDDFGISFVTTRTPAALRETNATTRAAELEKALNRMLVEGGVGRSMVVQANGDPRAAQLRLLPTQVLVVTDATTFVASFGGALNWSSAGGPEAELDVVRRLLAKVRAQAEVRSFALLRHVRVLPHEALQEDEKAPKKSGFVVTYVEDAPRLCHSDVYALEAGRDGGLLCRHRRGVPSAVVGTMLAPDDLTVLLDR